MFDISQSLQMWRNSLLESPSMNDDAIRELETHLLDSMEKLRRGGLNQEEAFLVATRRLGASNALESEFEKVNQQNVWERRALWILAAMQAVQFALAFSRSTITVCRDAVWNRLTNEQRDFYDTVIPVFGSLTMISHWLLLTGILYLIWKFVTKANLNLTQLMHQASRNSLRIGASLLVINLALNFFPMFTRIIGDGPGHIQLGWAFYLYELPNVVVLPIVLTCLLYRSGRLVKS